MSKVKVPVFGTVGKAVIFDPQAGARAEVAVAALAQQISAGLGGTIFHKSLKGLQVGDDHPQYTMWQAEETIQATWNFAAEPDIEGIPLTEFIEDVVGNELVEDSTSISWTYGDTANTLQAHIIDEYVQDLVGAMLTDSSTIDFTYSDLAGTLTASVIQSFAYSWTNNHSWDDNHAIRLGTGNDLQIYHDGTDSWFDNATGVTWFDGADNGFYFRGPAGTTREFGLTSGASQRWLFRVTSQAESGSNAGSNFQWLARNDSGGALFTVMTLIRSTGEVRFEAGNVWLDLDNQELQIGAGSDLRLYHDGTDSWVRNDTGILKLAIGANVALQFNTSRAFGVNGANYGTAGQVLVSQGSSSPPIWSSGAAGAAMAYVTESSVGGSAATNITFSSLDLDADKCYMLQIDLAGAAAGTATLNVFFNGDTTATNYERSLDADGTAVQGDNSAFGGLSNGDPGTWTAWVRRCPVTGRVTFSATGGRMSGTAAIVYNGFVIWDTSANLTSITINSSVASQIAIGSRVRLYKVTT
jgi:hypothetical protein